MRILLHSHSLNTPGVARAQAILAKLLANGLHIGITKIGILGLVPVERALQRENEIGPNRFQDTRQRLFFQEFKLLASLFQGFGSISEKRLVQSWIFALRVTGHAGFERQGNDVFFNLARNQACNGCEEGGVGQRGVD